MVDKYTPMTTLKEVKAWARENHLVYHKGNPSGLYCLRYRNKATLLFSCKSPTEFKDRANALRQWHEEHPA